MFFPMPGSCHSGGGTQASCTLGKPSATESHPKAPSLCLLKKNLFGFLRSRDLDKVHSGQATWPDYHSFSIFKRGIVGQWLYQIQYRTGQSLGSMV